MKKEVGRFKNNLPALLIFCRQNDLSGFFRDFFENSVFPTFEEFGYVGFRLRDRLAVENRVVNSFEDASGRRVSFIFGCRGFYAESGKKTRSLSGMTRWTDRLGFDQDGIPIAVDEEIFDLKKMPRRFPLLPELLPGTAPEMDRFGRECLVQG